MRKNLLILAALVLAAGTGAWAKRPASRDKLPVLPKPSYQITGDNPVPWPWGFEVPFPIESASGVWYVKYQNAEYYFAMTTTPAMGNSNDQIRIRQVDSACRSLSLGLVSFEGKVGHAQMRDTNGDSYWITLRAYHIANMPADVPVKPVAGKYVALTISSQDFSQEFTMPLQLLTRQIPVNCR